MSQWQRGTTIVLRNIARSNGTVTTAVPAITLQDERDALVVFIPRKTRYKNNWHVPADQRASSVDAITPSAGRRYQNLEF